MDNFTEDEFQATICKHGLNRTPQKILFSVMNITFSITAVTGNVHIIVALQKITSLRPPFKLLLGCLACTDLLVGLITQPLYVFLIQTKENSEHCFVLKVVSHVTGTIFSGVSLATLALISLDRLLVLALGLRYKQVVTVWRVRLCVGSIWFLGFAISMVYLYNYRIPQVISCILLLLCVVTSTFCYSKINWTLRYQQAQVHEQVQQGQTSGGGIPLNIARYKKVVFTALLVHAALLLCYLPYGIIVTVSAITGLQSQRLSIAWASGLFLIFLNSTLNPFLYCWKIREVRKAVKDTIRQLFCTSS